MHRERKFANYTFSIILLGALGAAVGLAIFFFGTPDTDKSRALISSPEFIIWVFINDVLFALYPILLALLWVRLRLHRDHLRRHWPELLFSSLILLALYMFPIGVAVPIIRLDPLPFEYSGYKIIIIESAGFLFSALPLTISIWLIQIMARRAFWDEPLTPDSLQEYADWSQDLQRYFLFYAVLLSLFIFASAAMRQIHLTHGWATEKQYPMILLLAFGTYYSLLIALIYLPAQAILHNAGKRLLNAFFPLSAPGSEAWDQTYAKRKELEEFLELKIAPEQRLATTITLLAPMVSGFLSMLVGT